MTELLPLLQEFHRDKLELLLRHEAGARLIPQYDVNNTYQYIINRDEVQLTWLETAIAELGGAVHPQSEPQRSIPGKGPEVARRVIEEDARDSQAFVDRWRPRVEAMDRRVAHRETVDEVVVHGEEFSPNRLRKSAVQGRVRRARPFASIATRRRGCSG